VLTVINQRQAIGGDGVHADLSDCAVILELGSQNALVDGCYPIQYDLLPTLH
tara:strand:+ start:175 stop:330 length:156 start_codon:yes stop_codon:yes gene_type:complete